MRKEREPCNLKISGSSATLEKRRDLLRCPEKAIDWRNKNHRDWIRKNGVSERE